MIIKQVPGVLKTYQENNVVKTNKYAKTESSRPTQQPDEVILSSSVQGFGSVLQSLLTMKDVREDKVASYQKAIEEGSYNVDAKAIAQKMFGRNSADQ